MGNCRSRGPVEGGGAYQGQQWCRGGAAPASTARRSIASQAVPETHYGSTGDTLPVILLLRTAGADLPGGPYAPLEQVTPVWSPPNTTTSSDQDDNSQDVHDNTSCLSSDIISRVAHDTGRGAHETSTHERCPRHC